jgi:hypothetical protein
MPVTVEQQDTGAAQGGARRGEETLAVGPAVAGDAVLSGTPSAAPAGVPAVVAVNAWDY